jgi:hypothetical protein
MNMPINRRSFLASLLAAPAALWAATCGTSKPTPQAKTVAFDGKPLTPVHSAEIGHQLQSKEWMVQGLAIKVPSNRYSYLPPSTVCTPENFEQQLAQAQHLYIGEWDGTFILEKGCTNPAYILADLYERTGAEPDWAVADRSVPASFAAMPMVTGGVLQLLKPRLNWQMLYDWGRFCDELVTGWQIKEGSRLDDGLMIFQFTTPGCRDGWVEQVAPRFTVNTACYTQEDLEELRQNLRMHCLSWQSTDPRYRTSWPGIPYPENRA